MFVISGALVLVDDDGEITLQAGDCSGFPHGGRAHHLANRSDDDATYLEVGDRSPGDVAEYPDDDLRAERCREGWRYYRRDGTPYA